LNNNGPKNTLLYNQNEYAEPPIIIRVEIIVINKFVSQLANNMNTSPTKLHVPGNAIFANVNTKNHEDNNGIT